MQKGFAPVLVLVGILAVVAAVIGAYFLGRSATSKSSLAQSATSLVSRGEQTPQPTSTPTASPDETANWKMYTNNEAKFSLKYPPSFSLTQQGNIISIGIPRTDNLAKINTYDNPQKQSLREFGSHRYYDFGIDNPDSDKDFKVTDFTMDGQPAINVELVSRDSQDKYHLYISNPLKDKVIVIYGNFSLSLNPNSPLSLSTFKFQ